jgi:hypothetical protein
MKAEYVSAEEYLENYKEYSSWINKALEHGSGGNTLLDLSKEIINGSHQLWIVRGEDSSIINLTVTTVITWEGIKTLHLVTTTGENWEGYNTAHHTLEEFGKLVGCERVTFWGRPGWDRIIKKLKGVDGQQYQKQYVVYNMSLGVNNATRT